MMLNLIKKTIIYLGILCAIYFFVSTTLAMQAYPGGTIQNRTSEGYSFFDNYFSDLGRSRAWNREPNHRSNHYFQTSLLLVGSSLVLFFFILPSFFWEPEAQFIAVVATICGIAASLCYIGIALTPLDYNYYRHTIFVRAGFISFLAMCFFYATAIFNERDYPNHYAWALLIFAAILFIQVAIMLGGPRSWSSPEALRLQATAQKIVVYSEILCMLYQSVGLLRVKRSPELNSGD